MTRTSAGLVVGGSVQEQHFNAQTDGPASVGVRELYLRGDPLRWIARAMGCGTEDICLRIEAQTQPTDELDRGRAVRLRSMTTNKVLLENEDMIERLYSSGIGLDEIPKVLNALDISVDAQTAAELFHIPGIPGGQISDEIPVQRVSDKLSLLYVIGVQHQIEPDYQLALGKMSLAAVSELRTLLNSHMPYRRMAEILAIIETTALAIRAGVVSTISYTEYGNTAQAISRRFGRITNDISDPWPVPADTLRKRYGSGAWEKVLNSVGIPLVASEDRFSEADRSDALDSFTEECIEFDYPMSIEIYDRWMIAAAAVGMEHPSAVSLIREYGSWEAAIETALGPSEEYDEEPDDHAFLWGFPFGFEDESLAFNDAKSRPTIEE